MLFFYSPSYAPRPFADVLQIIRILIANILCVWVHIVPDKWDVMNRKNVPNKLNINATAPLVLNWLNGLVA